MRVFVRALRNGQVALRRAEPEAEADGAAPEAADMVEGLTPEQRAELMDELGAMGGM